jgi:sugar phosphate isomerase/epimerase
MFVREQTGYTAPNHPDRRMPEFSLAHLTTLSLAPPQMVRVAARCGYSAVGLRLIQVTPESPGYPLMTDLATLRETRRAMADTGVRVNDIEFIRITPDTDIPTLEPFFATGAELGARWAVAAPYDPDPARLTDRFAALCDLAGSYGLGVALEFFPWTEIRGAADATRIAEATGRPNAAILVDALHFDRCGEAVTTLDAIAPNRMPFVHVCDAPTERPTTLDGLLHHARAERLPPGEGGLNITGVLAHMPTGIPIALEVPMTALTRTAGPEAVAQRVIQAARRLLPA